MTPSPPRDTVLQEMLADVEASPALYRPSHFWEHLNAINAGWLEEFGLDNFKRTVSQNYFNWLVVARRDPQFRAVLRAWLRRPSLRPLFTRMADPGLLRTTIGLERSFGAPQRLVYRLFVGLLWEMAAREDGLGLTRRLEEPSVGNPIETRTGGRLISQDLANSIRECNAVATLFGLPEARTVVSELGAGYGRLAHVFLAGTSARYLIFDIPPALHVSQWYLKRLFPDRKVFCFRRFTAFRDIEVELAASDVAFFTPSQLTMFPDQYADVFLSISTLPEMAQDQIVNYLSLMSRLSRRGVYLKQWRKWLNERDGFEFTYDRLTLPAPWKLRLDRPDAVQPLFQERAWSR